MGKTLLITNRLIRYFPSDRDGRIFFSNIFYRQMRGFYNRRNECNPLFHFYQRQIIDEIFLIEFRMNHNVFDRIFGSLNIRTIM